MSDQLSLDYTLDQFRDTYALDAQEAQRILTAVGTARTDLDAFMVVYRNRHKAESWIMDTAVPTRRVSA